ncbi:hypothetical protein TRVA0_016S02124 [Trichomonascus vanleenenianus]|uniref:uncharacterized protein n=1 Tax=Trichomonascus vanleenenianus TaxID=2268995 RepID=UPI003EC9E280
MASMNKSFKLPEDTVRSSKTELYIGGMNIYVIGLKEAELSEDKELATLYLLHGRGNTHLMCENIANQVLQDYRSEKSEDAPELVVVLFDLRNHGVRLNNDLANLTWEDGNDSHALHMAATIDGTVQDVSLIMRYLPMYLPAVKKIKTIIGGISIGGHCTWRMFELLGEDDVFAIAPIIASPNLTGVLLRRLKFESDFAKPEDYYKADYKEIGGRMDDAQRRRWPEGLHRIIAHQDNIVAKGIPTGMPILIMTGHSDPLVPCVYSRLWAQGHSLHNFDYYEQPNTGHTVTEEMVNRLTRWLLKILQ